MTPEPHDTPEHEAGKDGGERRGHEAHRRTLKKTKTKNKNKPRAVQKNKKDRRRAWKKEKTNAPRPRVGGRKNYLRVRRS